MENRSKVFSYRFIDIGGILYMLYVYIIFEKSTIMACFLSWQVPYSLYYNCSTRGALL